MEPFNSPNRGNDILSGAKYLKSEAEQVKWRNIYEDIKAFVVILYDNVSHNTLPLWSGLNTPLRCNVFERVFISRRAT